MIRRLITFTLGLALVVGLATPATASPRTASLRTEASHGSTTPIASLTGIASAPESSPSQVPPGEPGGYATVQTVLRYATGKRIGPSVYTGGGMFTITGFVQSPTGWERVRSGATCPSCEMVGVNGVTPNGVPQWAQPWTWDWGHILGEVWGSLWNRCLAGSVKGVVGTAGSTLLVNLIADGGKVYLGPYGYAAIAIGGCIALALD